MQISKNPKTSSKAICHHDKFIPGDLKAFLPFFITYLIQYSAVSIGVIGRSLNVSEIRFAAFLKLIFTFYNFFTIRFLFFIIIN